MATSIVFKGYDTNKAEEMNPVHGDNLERQAKSTKKESHCCPSLASWFSHLLYPVPLLTTENVLGIDGVSA